MYFWLSYILSWAAFGSPVFSEGLTRHVCYQAGAPPLHIPRTQAHQVRRQPVETYLLINFGSPLVGFYFVEKVRWYVLIKVWTWKKDDSVNFFYLFPGYGRIAWILSLLHDIDGRSVRYPSWTISDWAWYRDLFLLISNIRNCFCPMPNPMSIFMLMQCEHDHDCSRRSRRGLVQEDKRMAFVYTHGLFIT